jgi:hypothetical protein
MSFVCLFACFFLPAPGHIKEKEQIEDGLLVSPPNSLAHLLQRTPIPFAFPQENYRFFIPLKNLYKYKKC